MALELDDQLEGAADDEEPPLFGPELELLPAEPSKTSKFAVAPGGTVTTQNDAPPAPSVALPTISFTPFWLGSIAHGRPLQEPPLQVISTPQFGMVLLNDDPGWR